MKYFFGRNNMSNEQNLQQNAPTRVVCITDWDGTLRNGFLIVDWVLYLSKKMGVSPSHHRQLLALLDKRQRNEITYELFAKDALDIYGRAVCGLQYDQIRNISSKFVREDLPNLFPHSQHLLKRLKDCGYLIFVISGAPLIPVQAYCTLLPIDHVFGVDVERNDDGIFGERIIKNYALQVNKKRIIDKLLGRQYDVAFACGDTEADRPLLDAARHPFFVATETAPKLPNYPIVTPDSIIPAVERVLMREGHGNGIPNRRSART
jgi:phosphoserine phosphatase